jgi:chromosome partitioning protein
MTVVAIANQKGGVGKTTTATNLGAALGARGCRVLLVDCDAQGNATAGFGLRAAGAGLYDVLAEGVPAAQALVRTAEPGVDVVASTAELAGAEIELLDMEDRAARLQAALEDVRAWYSFVLLDCPPALGLLTLNALVAADAVLVPVQCEYLALEGLARLMTTIERVRTQANPHLTILGLVLTMYDARTMLSHQVASEVYRHYPTLTFETRIPRNVRLSEAPSFGQSIRRYDPSSRGSHAYEALAQEVISRMSGARSRETVSRGHVIRHG